jgi:tetratricopeptide (TPR) repeat protein
MDLSANSPERVLSLFGAAAFALLVLVFAYVPILDQDIWWHLKGGWYIVTHHRVPHWNTFAYPTKAPWVDLHWLFQVLAYELWQRFGPSGLIALKVGAIAATWGIITRLSSPRGRLLAMLPLLVLGVIAANERMRDRPETLTYLFLSVELALLLRWRRHPGTALLFVLVALQVVWANVHALSAIGVAVVGSFAVGEAIRLRLGTLALLPGSHPPLSVRNVGYLVLACVVCVVALAATPYGLKGAFFPLEILDRLHHYPIDVRELASPFSSFRPTQAVLAFHVLWVAVAGVVALSLPRVDISLLLTTLGLFTLAASARRNIPLFAITALPLVGAQLSVVESRLRRFAISGAACHPLRILASVGIVAAPILLARDVASGRFAARDRLVRPFGGGVYEGFVPKGAVDYVIANHLQGNVFNDIASGNYFIYRAYPKRRAFIDGRMEAVPDSLLTDYERALASDAGWRALDASYRFSYVLLAHRNDSKFFLIRKLRADPAWVLLYIDPVSIVFGRREELPAGIAVRDEIAPGHRPPPPYRPEPGSNDPIARTICALLHVREKADAWPPLLYAQLLARLGYVREAVFPADRALAADPGLSDAWLLRGALALASGDLARARESLEEAARLDPDNPDIQFRLGWAQLRLGDHEGAARALERTVVLKPGFAVAHLLLGAALVAGGDIGRAEDSLRRALSLNPALSDAYYYLAIAARERGDHDRERSFLRRYLALPGGAPELRANAARSLGVPP